MSMRTIWVAIRGANYSDQATRQVGKNVDELVRKQQALQKQMTKTFAAGVLFTVMAAMVGAAMLGLVEKTTEGRNVIYGLQRAVDRLGTSIGVQLLKLLGPTIQAITKFIDTIAQNEPLMRLLANLGLLVVALLAVKGGMFLITFVMFQLKTMWLDMTSTIGLFTVQAAAGQAAIGGLSGAFNILKASMGPAIMAFMLMFQLTQAMGEHGWVLVTVLGAITVAATVLAAVLGFAAMSMSILTIGTAAVIGAAAAYAAYQSIPTYAIGTQSVKRTGVAIVHQGEEIRSARQGFTGRGAATGTAPFPRTTNQFIFHVGTLSTRTDKEELGPYIKKILKDSLDNTV